MRTILCAGLLALLGALPAAGQEAPDPILKTGVNAIWFDNWIGLSNAMLRVASPDGKVETIVEEGRRAPTYVNGGAKTGHVAAQYQASYRARGAMARALPR